MSTIVKIETDLDAANVGRSMGFFERLANDPSDVVLDLRGVTIIDGSGLGALLHVYKRKSALGAKLSIANVSGKPREILSSLKVLSIMEYAGDSSMLEPVQVVIPSRVRGNITGDTAVT